MGASYMHPDFTREAKLLEFDSISITNTSEDEAKPKTRAMRAIVLVQVDLEVITRYLARICMCNEVRALSTQ